MHISFKALDARAVLSTSNEEHAFLNAPKEDKQRCKGVVNNRYWFELESTAFAKAYANDGEEDDPLASEFVKWCLRKQGSKRLQGGAYRFTIGGDNFYGWLYTVEERRESMPDRISTKLRERERVWR